MVGYPQEIKNIGGELQRSITATDYEVRVGDEVVKKQSSTQTYLYLYELNDSFYWRIKRSSYETKNSFFPQTLDIKVTGFKEGKMVGSNGFYGIDELTGEKYNVLVIPWNSGKGYFYLVGNTEKQIVYSVHVMDINVH